MSEETKRGRGRPKKNGGYQNHINIRLSDEEFEILEKRSIERGLTVSDTIRDALRAYELYFTIMERMDNSKK